MSSEVSPGGRRQEDLKLSVSKKQSRVYVSFSYVSIDFSYGSMAIECIPRQEGCMSLRISEHED